MSESQRQSWEEAMSRLRSAAKDLHSAVTNPEAGGPQTQAAADRLKTDVSRFEKTASDLLSKLASGLEQQRSGVESAFDRERAERATSQLRASLEDLAEQAGGLANKVAAATKTSIGQADPELKAATRALDDVVGSAAAWLRTVVDPDRDQRGSLPTVGRPPLDEL